ncbi:efflux RND transporter periplasmic adaptor subunit [Serratia marcescens]|uniref:efflux RND transporter periplasmic adaptor subunit n=1 Tax=Serratia marcescens TaxID=615 RepID=UPI002405DBC7|nr:efflux RND transporter periplasmic adaptor subunit [Serratia marcescens]MDF9720534.1 efflux RND transporter periplasmic adaptor subunit [Serratia marcescens]
MTQLIAKNTRPRFWSLQTLRTTVLVMPIVAALSACDAPSDKVAPPADKPMLTVALTTPAIQPLSRTVTANGSIAAWQEAFISPEANGLRVQKLLVQEGDVVRQGQPLAEFTRDSVMNDWLLAKADLNEAKAITLNAQADGKRARLLRGVGSLSEQDIQTQEKTAQARLESAKARMAAQQLRLDQTILRAPDDGIISARSATIGSVPMQSTEMFRLIRQGKFEWRAELSAQQLEQIQPGQKAQIASPGGNTWEGVVRLAAPTVNSTSRRGIAYVDILPSTAKNASPIRPGTYASGLITVGDRQGLTVPQSAVVARDGFHLVFTVDDELRAHPLKVAVGRLVNDQQEILSGLQGAERIVASGGVFLNEGDKVQLANTAEASHSSEPR